jgi:hypothetical protein
MSRIPWMTCSTGYLQNCNEMTARVARRPCDTRHASPRPLHLHGETNAEPARMRKVQVFSGSNQHARALEHFDKEPPLAVPRALREKRRQINAHAQDGHNQACTGCFGVRAFTAAVAAAGTHTKTPADGSKNCKAHSCSACLTADQATRRAAAEAARNSRVKSTSDSTSARASWVAWQGTVKTLTRETEATTSALRL